MGVGVIILILAVLVFLIVFVMIIFGITRPANRNNVSNNVSRNPAEVERTIPVNNQTHAKQGAKTCTFCGGMGYKIQTQQRVETKMETTTEYYTNHLGQRQSRTVTRPKTASRTVQVNAPCTSCGGSGRRMY